MSHTHVIDPVNRIEGDLAIELTVDENNKIEDAKCLGFVYRGLENIFIGRKPFDAMRLSQRACGVCPVSHGTAGAYAIEAAADFKIPRNAELIRDIVLGANFIVSHATHFYFMWGPDLVNHAYKDYELYPEIVKRFDPLQSPHLKAILKEARIPLHSVVATFGGKFPHPMHAVPGGVTCFPKQIEINKVVSILSEVKEFIEREILNGITVEDWLTVNSVNDVLELMNDDRFKNSDVGLFIRIGQDLGLHKFGEGSPHNFLSYGFGHNNDGSWLFKPGYVENGVYSQLDIDKVTEETGHSYYETEEQPRNPKEGITRPVPNKDGAYSWLKAARYDKKVIEAGPLARQMVNGDPLITDLVNTFGVNTFTRTLARLHECLLILPKLIGWVDEIDLTKPFYSKFPKIITDGQGVGLTEAPRGALGHWVNIKNSLIKSYQIITPTTFNCAPLDSFGQKGAVEQALTGVQLRDRDSILEAGHIVRSFDPCISCSIHAVGSEKKRIFIEHSH
ncbi:MAG: nickel-dependent hydrogenase large subunit [ANME-2 cluster archaeon]|nr:nickel-dependent hydrogenase large subunit [ANME-2 cluster archaeon]MDF1531053.1 nickel-dependent hydrogenase large subunit [ANME-2 cluster archaeon]